jgi:hypothetical protein
VQGLHAFSVPSYNQVYPLAMQTIMLCSLCFAASLVLPASALLVGEEQADAAGGGQSPCGASAEQSMYIGKMKEAALHVAQVESMKPPTDDVAACDDDDAAIIAQIDSMTEPEESPCESISCGVVVQEPSAAMKHAQEMHRKGDFLLLDAEKTDAQVKDKEAYAAKIKTAAMKARKEAYDDYRLASDEANGKAKAAKASAAAAESAATPEADQNDGVHEAKRKAQAAKEEAAKAQECARRSQLAQTSMNEMASTASFHKCQADAEALAATEMALDVAAEAQKAMSKFGEPAQACHEASLVR